MFNNVCDTIRWTRFEPEQTSTTYTSTQTHHTQSTPIEQLEEGGRAQRKIRQAEMRVGLGGLKNER